eukprot:scaffold79022_cov17-Prasinocladus_malaysianus.AAC.1
MEVEWAACLDAFDSRHPLPYLSCHADDFRQIFDRSAGSRIRIPYHSGPGTHARTRTTKAEYPVGALRLAEAARAQQLGSWSTYEYEYLLCRLLYES